MGQNVLLISSGVVHPSVPARRALRASLSSTGSKIAHTSSVNDLIGMNLSRFEAIVLYFHHETVNPEALEILEQFVEQGGGLLAWHAASASFKGNERYSALLGGHFVEHGPIETFTIVPDESRPSIFDDVPSFSVRDELYRHAYDRNNRVVLHTSIDGQTEPVCWVREQGQGRVFYCALGHTVSSMRHPAVRLLMASGLKWVTRTELA